MESKFSKLEEELKELVNQGELLQISIAIDLGILNEKQTKEFKDFKLPDIKDEYQKWYSLSLQVIRQILPDRLDDFVFQYKNEKRKNMDFITYTISDYLIGVKTTRGYTTVVDGKAAYPKFETQLNILKSAETRFKNVIFDISEVLQADIFDSEIEAAKELNKKGFIRASGAIGGVVLEKHLSKVCSHHSLKSRKKNPTISDFYQLLKENGTIDTAQWRFIQHLGDIRNLCDHPKDKEPTKDEIVDFLSGIEKIIKTVY
jgi:hypothetical protein